MSARTIVKDVRDSTTLSMLREAYRPGTKVEAVKVKNVAAGVVGIVREVKPSGEISVLWNTGEIGDVEFGIDSVRIVNGNKCMVRRKPDDQACTGDKCSECGWNEEVHRERLKRIEAGEMEIRKTSSGKALCLVVKKSRINPAAPKLLNSPE